MIERPGTMEQREDMRRALKNAAPGSTERENVIRMALIDSTQRTDVPPLAYDNAVQIYQWCLQHPDDPE
jgi:hypothetical protein